MHVVVPGYVGISDLQESIGTIGCGAYVGLVVVFHTRACLAHFTSVSQVDEFFELCYYFYLRNEKPNRICMFCTLPILARDILAQIQKQANRPVPCYNADSMYTVQGQVFPGNDCANGDEFMEICDDYHRAQMSLSSGTQKLKFINFQQKWHDAIKNL
jgi:hypothetical protein